MRHARVARAASLLVQGWLGAACVACTGGDGGGSGEAAGVSDGGGDGAAPRADGTDRRDQGDETDGALPGPDDADSPDSATTLGDGVTMDIACAGSDEQPLGASAVDLGDGRVAVTWQSTAGLELAEVDPCDGVVWRRILPAATAAGRAALGSDGLVQVPARLGGDLVLLGVDRLGAVAEVQPVAGVVGTLDVVGRGGATWLVAGNGCNGAHAVAARLPSDGAATVLAVVPTLVGPVRSDADADGGLVVASAPSGQPTMRVARLGAAGEALWVHTLWASARGVVALPSGAAALVDVARTAPILQVHVNTSPLWTLTIPGDGVLPDACLPSGSPGDRCEGDAPACEAGSVCSEALGGVCASPAPAGTLCATTAECAAGTTCAVDMDWEASAVPGNSFAPFGCFSSCSACGATTCKSRTRCVAPAGPKEPCGGGIPCQEGLVCTYWPDFGEPWGLWTDFCAPP